MGNTRLVLFVKLRNKSQLDENLIFKIKNKIKNGASPRHIPSKILEVVDIPRTKSGKIAEIAVRDLIHGKEIKNKTALANPECIQEYLNIDALKH